MLKISGLLVCFILCYPEAESKVTIENNGYKGIVIAINPEIEENPALIDALKNAWTDASRDLFRATRKRAFFEEITILVPTTWKTGTYSPSGDETYKKADVVIAYPNPAYPNIPYTVQYGTCGEPGSYIHLTPKYLLDDQFINGCGPRGKTIVREWAHYRYGIFDEVVTSGYNPFYLSTSGKVEPNRCSVMIKGDNFVFNREDGSHKKCKIHNQTLLPEDGCVFVPDKNASSAAEASMMSYQYLDSVYKFCHDDTSDSQNLHNKEAPNEHNRLCNLRSTWDVISSNADFYGNSNPSQEEIPTTDPNFKVVQPKSYERFVLVLDTSGSMDGYRMTMLRHAASAFLLQSVPQNSEVGIVQFSTSAYKISDLVEIKSYADRKHLVDLLPTIADGYTSIGSGILQAIEVLEKDGNQAQGGTLIVLGDGGENTEPTLHDVYHKTIQSGVVVYSIEFTDEADEMLEVIANATGGVWYFADENSANATTALTDAFVTVAQVDDGDSYRKTFEIYSTSLNIDPSDQYDGRIIVDGTIGNNTVFTFTWSHYNVPPRVVLMAPNGCNYDTLTAATPACDPANSFVVNNNLKTIHISINGTAETGTWIYYVNTQSPFSQKVVVTVTSMASNRSIEPFVVESGMGQVEASDGQAIVVYAKVSMGHAPVLNADVEAKIERPTGDAVLVELRDKGAAPDIRSNDGIYSRYFTNYSGPGRYSVQVTVSGTEGKTTSAHISASSGASCRIGRNNAGILTLDPDGESPDFKQTDTGNWSRHTSAGGFHYNGTSYEDTFPPSKITDLVAVQREVTQKNKGIAISFTAPGDDYDDGAVTKYDIRYTYEASTKLVEDFDGSTIVASSDMTSCCYTDQKEAGSQEEFSFVLSDIPVNISEVSVSIAVRAIDEVGNMGEVSNVVILTYFIDPLVLEVADPVENPGMNLETILMIAFSSTSAILLVIVIVAWKLRSMKKAPTPHNDAAANDILLA